MQVWNMLHAARWKYTTHIEMSTGRAAARPGPHFWKFSQKHSRDTGHTAIYQGKPKFSWNPLTLFIPRQQTTYSESRCTAAYTTLKQSPLLWAVAGRRVGTGRKFSTRAHLYSASTNILVYFSTPVDSLCPLLTFCHKQIIYLLA